MCSCCCNKGNSSELPTPSVISNNNNKPATMIPNPITVLLFILSSYLATASNPAPQTISEQQPIPTNFQSPPFHIAFSPDMSSLAYMPGPQNSCKYIKFRSSIWNSTQTPVDGSRVVSIAFSPTGNRLYYLVKNSTKYYMLKYFHITNNQINQTSQWLLDINVQDSDFIASMIAVSADGNVAVSINRNVYIVMLTPDSSAVARDYTFASQAPIADLQWYHEQNETLFIGSYSFNGTVREGEFIILNATQKSRTGYYNLPTRGIGMTRNGFLLLDDGNTTNLYAYDEEDIDLIITLRNNYHIHSTSVFPNKMYFATWSDAGDIKVYKIMFSSSDQSQHSSYQAAQPLKSLFYSPSHQSLQNIELITLLSRPSASHLTFAGVSQDNNDIYFYQQNNSNLLRWARCPDGSYFQDSQCYQCNPTCKTCMFSIFHCTSCEQGYYLTQNQVCSQCSDAIDFCLNCSLSAATLNCDKCLPGFVYSKDTKKCICPEGYEFTTTTTCSKIVPLPDNDTASEVQLWQLWLGLGAVIILNALMCVGGYWKIQRRLGKYEKLQNGEGKQEKARDELRVSNSMIGDRDQIRQRLMYEGQ